LVRRRTSQHASAIPAAACEADDKLVELADEAIKLSDELDAVAGLDEAAGNAIHDRLPNALHKDYHVGRKKLAPRDGGEAYSTPSRTPEHSHFAVWSRRRALPIASTGRMATCTVTVPTTRRW
jgi:hypothetical protein